MSDAFTIGVEEEYQLVSQQTGELKSRAAEVIRGDWSQEIQPEIQQTMLESGTRVCADAAELRRELARVRCLVSAAAEAHDLSIVAAGLHPFSVWAGQRHTDEQRYQRLIRHFGRVMRTEHVFGMHVHVAVPEEEDRVRLLNVLRAWLPHLLALSASSPLFEGMDTGYASYRTILTGRLPHSGIPPRLRDEREFRRFLERATAAGSLEDEGALYWSLRPHPSYPTLEFRVTDVCLRLEDAVAVAALARALTHAAVHGELREPEPDLSDSAWDAMLAANQWQAARFGLDARLISSREPEQGEPLRDAIGWLLERLAPHARALGDEDALDGIAALLQRGNGADRMREVVQQGGSLTELTRWLARESVLGTGMDRRRALRAE